MRPLSKNNSFAQNTIILTIAFIVIISGFVYGAYKFNEAKEENNRLRNELANQNSRQESQEKIESNTTLDQSISTTTEIKEEVLASTTKVSEALETGNSDEIRTKPEKEIVYIKQAAKESESERQAEIEKAVNEALAKQQQSQINIESTTSEKENELEPKVTPETTFKVVAIRQTAYPDEYGGVYGAYEMEVAISSTESDILVPPTTSNTIGTGDIGFSYTIVGDSFRGIQNSRVSCSLQYKNYCKIKNDGQLRNIIVTVFLYPDKESNSNYAINFDKIYYYKNGSKQEYVVDRQTAPISIKY